MFIVSFAFLAFHYTFTGGNLSHCSEQAFQIKQKADFLTIFTVKASLDIILQFITSINLRPACKSGTNIIGSILVAFRKQFGLSPSEYRASLFMRDQ